MIKIDPGAIGFTSGFSRGHMYSTVGEQITVEQLTELSIVMGISRHDHVYRHHVRCYLLSTALDFPEEERMMQQSSVSISLSF